MMRTLLKLVLLFFIFAVLFVLPVIVIPLHVETTEQSQYNTLMFLLLLLTQFFTVIYLIKRLDLWGVKLVLAVVIVFWGLQTFMTQIETWYFRDAIPAITNDELRNLFLRPLLTSITFIPLAILLLGKWKENSTDTEFHLPSRLSWQEMLILSVAYVVIYFTFGYFIAWQFEDVRVFYSGSADDGGFIGGLRNSLQTDTLIFPFQLLRGFLWVVIGLPILLYLKGSKREKVIACIILCAIPTVQLLVDNPFMPPQVRMAHLLEVSTSNGLFGYLIGYVATRKDA